MILIFVSFLTVLILSVGAFLISFNFFGANLSVSMEDVFQSKIINQQNLSLFSGYKQFYNSGVSDNDFRCYSGTAYEDNNCFFKGLYGFIPPNTTLDLGTFQNLSGNGLNLSVTGDISKGGEILLRGLDGQGINKVSFSSPDSYLPYQITGNYNIKIKNNGTSRIQYFLSLTGSEGFDYALNYSSGYAYYSKDFSPQIGGNKILNSTNLLSNSNLLSCAEIYNANPLSLSGSYFLRSPQYLNGITGYCDMSLSGYTYPFDTSTSVANTKLLLQSEAANGTTNFSDSMGNAYTFTVNGTLANSTTKAKFGKSSIYFPGNGSLALSDSSNFNFGNGDFTIDFWTYASDYSNGTLLGKRPTSGTSLGPILICKSYLYMSSNGISWDIADAVTFTGGTIPVNQWVHWAVTRSGTNIYTFLNGYKMSTVSTSATLFLNTDSLRIGGDSNGYYFNGYIEEFRITKGQALRTSNFTPPALPYKF